MHLFTKFASESNKYIYDTWTNAILCVDDHVFELIPQAISDKESLMINGNRQWGRAMCEIEEARSQGYLRDERLTVVSFDSEAMDSLVDDMLYTGPHQMVLNVTEQCNLRCRYCAFSGSYHTNRTHGHKSMSWDLSKSALDWYFDHTHRKEYRIGFYGGEPLLVLPLLKKIAHYSRERAGAMCHFNITTNATLMDKEICDFLIEEEFTITVSLDGPEQIHNRYRVDMQGNGSFDRVMNGLDLLRESDPDGYRDRVSFNAVLAPPLDLKSIGSFVENNRQLFQDTPWMVSSLNPQPSNVMDQLDSSLPKIPESAQYQELFDSFDHMILNGNPSGLERSIFSGNLIRIHLRPMNKMKNKSASHGQCLPGERKVFVSTDGRMYMCERVGTAYPVGKIPDGIEAERVKDFLRAYNDFFSDRCNQCWAIRLCRKCFSDLRIGNHFSNKMADGFCESQKHSIKKWLAIYCHFREQKDDAFEWIEGIEIG